MTKEQLVELGLSDEQATKVLGLAKDLVTKEKFEEVETEKKRLEGEVKERDKQLEKLKTSTKDIESLKEQINNLQEENKTKDEKHKAEIAKQKIDNAIDLALSKANAKNSTAVRSLLSLDDIVIDEDGKVTGLDKQMQKLISGEDTSFLFTTSKDAGFKGVVPGATNTPTTKSEQKENFAKMGYKERVELYNNNPEQYQELKG